MKTWLLVEDEQDISEMLLAVFDLWSINCIAYQSGEETVAWLEHIESGEAGNLPELALIDIRLSGDMDGIAVAQRIRKSPILADIVIVLNTAYTLTEKEIQHCLLISGANRVMRKPLPNFEILYREFQNLIENNTSNRSFSTSEHTTGTAMENQEISQSATDAHENVTGYAHSSSAMRTLSLGGAYSRRIRERMQKVSLIVIGGSFLAFMGLTLSVVPLVGREGQFANLYRSIQQGVLFAGISLALLGVFFAWSTFRKRAEYDITNLIIQQCREHFDSRYTLVIKLKSREMRGVDALLAGPPGLLMIRLLDIKGDIYNERGYWLQASQRGEFAPLSSNPTRDLLRDIHHLQGKLNQEGIDGFPIFGTIVFTSPISDLRYHSSQEIIPVSHLSTLYDDLQNGYLRRERVTMRALSNALHKMRIPSRDLDYATPL